VDASLRYAAPMGSGDGFTVADAGVRWEFKPGCELRIQGTNLTDSQAVASFRPYGARPIAPRMVRWGLSFSL